MAGLTGREFEPKAERPMAGLADLCSIAETPLDEVQRYLARCEIAMIGGPVERTGDAVGLFPRSGFELDRGFELFRVGIGGR